MSNLVKRLLAQANCEANDLADLLNEAAVALAAQSYQPDRCLWARNGNEACTMPSAHQPHIDLLEEIKWAEEELSSLDEATAQVVAKSFKAVIEKIKVEK